MAVLEDLRDQAANFANGLIIKNKEATNVTSSLYYNVISSNNQSRKIMAGVF